MTEITAIGLGLMGSALARTLHEAGHWVTVWNRSAGRMDPFAAMGVGCAPDAASAIAASPVLLICIDGYDTTRKLLEASNIAPLLNGRTVVQLSTGTPREAREAAVWMRARGARYLDGAILCGPQHVGTGDGVILFSGEPAANQAAGGLLHCLGGRVRYLGEDFGAAAALDLAWLTTCYGRFLGLAHAASLVRAEGAEMADLVALFPDQKMIQHYLRVVEDGSFDEATGTLRVWSAALERIRRQGRDAGINTDIPDFAAKLFRKAVAAGHGEKNVMSLLKVLEEDA